MKIITFSSQNYKNCNYSAYILSPVVLVWNQETLVLGSSLVAIIQQQKKVRQNDGLFYIFQDEKQNYDLK
jgi:hypothetical protein